MKRSVSATVFLAALTLVGMLPSASQAFGRRHRGNDCAPACEAPCASECAAPACAPAAPVAPVMVATKVTRYKQQWKERQVTENICRIVPRQENYTYTVSVPVTKQVARNITTYDRRTKEVPYTFTVMVPKPYQEKRTVISGSYP